MLNDVEKDARQRMEKSIKSFGDELAKQRAGRASPQLFDGIMVSYYGTPTPLQQVASVVIESALMIVIKPWEKQLGPDIEKAILKSDLGLNPASSGDTIRVPLPALTEERRKELMKKVRGEGENAKVSIRNIRRDANQMIKDLLKEKEITEDDERRAQDRVQKLTDEFIKQVDELLGKKEADLMVI